MKSLLLASLIGVVTSSTLLPVSAWRGITPLKSTRSDVERVLGKPTHIANYWARYRTDAEVISILYSNGQPCGRGLNSEWNVPEWRVISITVAPRSIVLFSSLNIDTSKYRKVFDPHSSNHIEYSNEEEGEWISVAGDEISSFRYTPDRASNHIKCATERLNPQPSVSVLGW
jgi:hypothetical protein